MRNIEKNKVYAKEINTVGELKELLSNFDNDMFINVGTKELGFSINSYATDLVSLALFLEDLDEYIK